jgi:hypothetical protein
LVFVTEPRAQSDEVPSAVLNGGSATAIAVAQEETVAGSLPTTSAPWPRVASALRHRNFRYFWFGNLFSNVGTWMQNVAQGWLVLQLAGANSAFWLGVVASPPARPCWCSR